MPPIPGMKMRLFNQHNENAFLIELLSFSGQAGVDFPVLASVPDTGFDCGAQQFPGIYGDTGADCQVRVIVSKLILFLEGYYVK